MACSDYSSLGQILRETNEGWPIDAVWCPFASDLGAGMGEAVFALAVFGPLGLALTVRTQHPAPIFISGILLSGVFASAVPGAAAKVATIVIFFAITGMLLIAYRRAQSTL